MSLAKKLRIAHTRRPDCRVVLSLTFNHSRISMTAISPFGPSRHSVRRRDVSGFGGIVMKRQYVDPKSLPTDKQSIQQALAALFELSAHPHLSASPKRSMNASTPFSYYSIGEGPTKSRREARGRRRMSARDARCAVHPPTRTRALARIAGRTVRSTAGQGVLEAIACARERTLRVTGVDR